MNPIDTSRGQTTRDPFYLGMSLFSLGIVLVGFTRGFYLADYFGFPDLPPHLVIHGVVLTIWFVLACSQPYLIRIRHPQIHRRLGIVALATAAAVVATGVWTVAMRDVPTIDEYPSRAVGNLASLFMFLFCVILGFRFRRNSDRHKRLMMMASIPILAPALDRFARIPMLNDLFGKTLYWFPAPPEVAFATVAFLTLLLVTVIHDLVREKRVHAGTVWGLVAILVFSPIATTAVISTGGWVGLVKWFS